MVQFDNFNSKNFTRKIKKYSNHTKLSHAANHKFKNRKVSSSSNLTFQNFRIELVFGKFDGNWKIPKLFFRSTSFLSFGPNGTAALFFIAIPSHRSISYILSLGPSGTTAFFFIAIPSYCFSYEISHSELDVEA